MAHDVDECGRAAVDRLFPIVYQELERIARRHRQRERPDHTLNTTGLVHEAYMKLLGLNRIAWQRSCARAQKRGAVVSAFLSTMRCCRWTGLSIS